MDFNTVCNKFEGRYTADLTKHSLPVDPRNYAEHFPLFELPLEIGNFSHDKNKQFHNDDREIKYLVTVPHLLPYARMNLFEGYSSAVHKDSCVSGGLDLSLRWILENKCKLNQTFPPEAGTSNWFKMDFICYRGLLTMLVCTPYENRDDWIICATKFKGVIYLYSFSTERRIKEEENKGERLKLICFGGYKFEQYMTTKSPNIPPDTKAVLNEYEEYCIMMKGKLGNMKLLYGAEVDAIDTGLFAGRVPVGKYCELKTSRIITSDKQYINFCRHKLMKWWAQSFLIGINRVICGFRKDNGLIADIKSYAVSDFPVMGKHWKPSVGMNFCKTFLEFVKNIVIKDDPHVVYKFDWEPGRNVTVQELVIPGQFQILPEWYISGLGSFNS